MNHDPLIAMRAIAVETKRSKPPTFESGLRDVFSALQSLMIYFPQRQFLDKESSIQLKEVLALFGAANTSESQRVTALITAVIEASTTTDQPRWQILLQKNATWEARLYALNHIGNPKSPKYEAVHDFAALIVEAYDRKHPRAESIRNQSDSNISQHLITNITWLPPSMIFGYRKEQRRVENALAKHVVAIITGDSGMGKSTLARTVLSSWRTKAGIVWSVDCTTPDSAATDYFELGQRIGQSVTTGRPAIAEMREVLTLASTEWCLLLDNLQQPSDLDEYIPIGGGRVVVTSQVRRGWGGRGTTITLRGLDETSAIAMLLQRSGSKDRNAASALAETVFYLPVALDYLGGVAEINGLAETTHRNVPEVLVTPLQGALPEPFVVSVQHKLDNLPLFKDDAKEIIDFLRSLAIFGGGTIPRWFLDGRLPSTGSFANEKHERILKASVDYYASLIFALVAAGIVDADARFVYLHPAISSIVEEHALADKAREGDLMVAMFILELAVLVWDLDGTTLEDRDLSIATVAKYLPRVINYIMMIDRLDKVDSSIVDRMDNVLRHALPVLVEDGWWEAADRCIEYRLRDDPSRLDVMERQHLYVWQYLSALLRLQSDQAGNALKSLLAVLDESEGRVDEGIAKPLYEYEMYADSILDPVHHLLYLDEVNRHAAAVIAKYRESLATSQGRYGTVLADIQQNPTGEWQYSYFSEFDISQPEVAEVYLCLLREYQRLHEAAFYDSLSEAIEALTALRSIQDIGLVAGFLGCRRILLNLVGLAFTLMTMGEIDNVRVLADALVFLREVLGPFRAVDVQLKVIQEWINAEAPEVGLITARLL